MRGALPVALNASSLPYWPRNSRSFQIASTTITMPEIHAVQAAAPIAAKPRIQGATNIHAPMTISSLAMWDNLQVSRILCHQARWTPSCAHLTAYPPGGGSNVRPVKTPRPIPTIHAFHELNTCVAVPNIQGVKKRMPLLPACSSLAISAGVSSH